MKTALNYFGQLRIYSLLDLFLLLIAVQADQLQFAGAIILHITFLMYLEAQHAHQYRGKVPKWLAYVLAIVGLILYKRVEGFIYLIFVFLYTRKTKDTAIFSPLCRGFQNFFIIAGIAGYSPVAYLAGGLSFLRNLLGDFRDVERDMREGVKTIPVTLGLKKDIKYIHLIATMATSFVWWNMAALPVTVIGLVWVVQIATYNLTPR